MLNDKQLLTLQMFGGQLLRFSVGMSLSMRWNIQTTYAQDAIFFSMQICQLIKTVILFRLSIVKA